MTVIHRFYQEATRRRLRVVLPEGHDPRVVQAAVQLKREELAHPILLGKPDDIAAAAEQAGADATESIRSTPRPATDWRPIPKPISHAVSLPKASVAEWSESH